MSLRHQAVQNTLTCWKCVMSAFLWNRFVSQLDPSPCQGGSLADAIHLTRVREQLPRNARTLSGVTRHRSGGAGRNLDRRVTLDRDV
jgi:hypothetical protein